jgi:PAS domain S-box-containing protein
MPIQQVLLIDDDPNDRELILRELKKELPGAEILQIGSSDDFEAVLKDADFELVITDYQLNWTNGIHILKRLKKEKPMVPVIMFTASAGEEIAVDAMKSGLDDYIIKSTGQLMRLRGSIRAAADHIAHQQALIEAELRYRDLFQGIPIGLYQTSPDGRFLEINRAMVEMLGFPNSDILFKTPTRQLYASDEDYNAWSVRMKKSGYVKELIVKMKRYDGDPIWVEINGKQVFKDGVLHYNEGSLQDVTDRILYQMEMKANVALEVARALDKERQLGDLRSQFITMTSHEFRTPLSSILTSAELLEHYGQKWSYEKITVHLKRIQDAVKHIISMMDDILYIGKSDAGKIPLQKEPMNLDEFMTTLIAEHRHSSRNSHPIDYISRGDCTHVMGDKKLIRQIMTNLISNSLKYSTEGSQIVVRMGCNGALATIDVEDEGIGIPSEQFDQIFEPFFRAKNVGDIIGTGLGLPIVKRSVEAHGGSITVSARKPTGTKFSITLEIS